MRFKRFIRPVLSTEFSPRRIAAAEQAIRKDKYNNALTPELIKYNSASSRLQAVEKNSIIYWRNIRNLHAKHWRRGRSMLAHLPEKTRKEILSYWNIYKCPAEGCYFCDVIQRLSQ